ncbi:MAG: protein-(glutamine-N5) methyltransferase, release factor-specific [Bacteroidetes bacterium GWF2_33_16]|nr:MAG: protein-(glutamine-N5) methyltransferase, release factor-specific [Bacteroidetes bacterium GWE2_32_14]OFY03649.1 MAG: protein-(glutamine-N5) methyltransferase, release factor-specific [Bacteroidetes bacterium GWF2_33_16]
MSSNYNIKEIILWIKSELKSTYPSTEIDAFINIIFHYILKFSRTQIILNEDQILSTKIIQEIDQIISELKVNKPIQYIIGQTEFYNLYFNINSGVLIPRPETEELVHWIINENHKAFYKILDIGTGSGCIAISLAKNMPASIVSAIDVSNEALSLARKNCVLNNVDIQLFYFNILQNNISINETYDIIVSNPPYVTESEKKFMNPNVIDYEPHLALFVPDNDPLKFYREIIKFAKSHLNQSGKIYFEINESFGPDIALLLEEENFSEIIIKKDINNKNRMIRAILK